MFTFFRSCSPKQYSIAEISAQSESGSMTQDSQVRLKCLLQSFLVDLSLFKQLDFLIQLAKHSFLGSFAQCTVVRKRNVAEKINATSVCTYGDLAWMQLKVEMIVKEVLDFRDKVFQEIFVIRCNNKIISVANIIFNFQFFFHKLIKLIHVDIGEQLRCQITNRKPSSGKQIGKLSGKTLDYFLHKPQSPKVFHLSLQKLDQDSVVNTIKKLSDITFKCIRCLSVILRDLTKHYVQNMNAFMSSFSDAAGKRMGYKSWFKNWIEYLKNCMMQHSVSNRRFMNMSEFRIINIEVAIRSMPICLTY